MSHDLFYTGDLLTRDSEGFLYWSDRVGDTFRWKGENVATTEIENVLDAVKEFADVTVYGVPVPDYDGKVGMAAVVLKEGLGVEDVDWSGFHKECTEHLTSYSRPAFVRVQEAVKVTATFKHQKSDLVKDGFDPAVMNNDKLFLYDQRNGKVLPLTADTFQQINSGKIKL
jgi:acyl-CoA synthetase (AMP-forming)/AMP-acid ligase II